MTQHTQEPWRVTKSNNYIGITAEAGGPMVLLDMNMVHVDRDKNAHRIVACVNACEGIDIDYLQSPDNLATYARNMALQRDEAYQQLFEIRALVGAQTEELIQDAIKRLIAERDQCKADFEAQFNKVGA